MVIRDYLRTHPDEARQYGELKETLKSQFPEDYREYRRHKDAYVRELWERVKKAK